MKTTLMAALLLMSANSFADFSQTNLGQDNGSQDKVFSQHNQERLHSGTSEIILTFDDGPTPGVTEKVLDTLKEYGAKATFFVIAEKAKAAPALMQRILDEGHIVGNHSLTHKALNSGNVTFLNWKKLVRTEVLGAHEILGPYMANGQHFYYRAPEGAWDSKFADLLNKDSIGQQYIGPILWDIGGELRMNTNGAFVEAADWACWSKKITVDDCLSGYLYEARTKKGGVVLMHDLRHQSAEMLAKFIPALQKNGFSFKTLDDVDWAARKK
jgi:peptidoglycan/xylan/chitin deacetylase (PgdA/CDA1 family)